MTRSVRIRPEAEADMHDAYHWYEEQAYGLGEEFLRAADAAIASIQRHPEAYPKVYESVRRAFLRKFPYGLFYVIEPDMIVVLACFYVRRDPKSWRDRA